MQIRFSMPLLYFHEFRCNPPEVEADDTTKHPSEKTPGLRFCHCRCSGLRSNGSFWTTEEALSLIKEEEVLISCEYIVPPNRTSQKCSSEQEGKQANSLTFDPHMTSKGHGDLSKV